jgi:hypothetical protein
MSRTSFWFVVKAQMRDRIVGKTPSQARSKNSSVGRVVRSCVVFLLLLTLIPAAGVAQNLQQTKLTDSAATPEPAIFAILSAFDKLRSHCYAGEPWDQRLG